MNTTEKANLPFRGASKKHTLISYWYAVALSLSLVYGCGSPGTATTSPRVGSPSQPPSSPPSGSHPVVVPVAQDGSQASPAELDPQIVGFLKVHNDARAAVGVPPLKWSANLARYAQEWADHLAKPGVKFDHREPNEYGENLAEAGSPQRAAELWLGEKQYYDNGPIKAATFAKTGHYTAMVWRNTTQVGYGVAQKPGGRLVIVANYSQAGNILGRHPYR